MQQNIKVILIPGNGHSSPQDNWLPYTKLALENLGLIVLAPQFPDTPLAREAYWLPFIKNELGADHNTILIGHSTGAIVAMRFAQTHKILGSILVGTYHTDLGMESEKLSGYFNRPWDWQAISSNQKFIIQFASTDDPWIPIAEARMVHKQLNTQYHEYTDQGHFGGDYYKPQFPELVAALKKNLVRE